MSNSTALASLTATYTDSEGEEEADQNENEDSENVDKNGVEVTPPMVPKSADSSLHNSPAVIPVRVTTKVTTLVSYHDDTIASDEENDGEESAPKHEVILLSEEPVKETPTEPADNDGVLIPPEPPGFCSIDLQDKIAKYYDKMKNENLDNLNGFIEKIKDFRNPSIYEKLLQFCAINELGTNYPPAIYDSLKWSKESYYEELAKVQKAEIEKRERERKKVELLSGAKKIEDDIKKRKSKWDQPGGHSVNVKPAGLIAPSLTTNVTGTKSTVISAFGSLPKKPKM